MRSPPARGHSLGSAPQGEGTRSPTGLKKPPPLARPGRQIRGQPARPRTPAAARGGGTETVSKASGLVAAPAAG